MRPDMDVDMMNRDFRGPPPMEMRGGQDMRGPPGSEMMGQRDFRGGAPSSMERDDMRMREMRGPPPEKGLFCCFSLVSQIYFASSFFEECDLFY